MSQLNTYKIEHKILTLVRCAVIEKKEDLTSFDIDRVNFSHWDYNTNNNWVGDSWIATATINAKNYVDAINELGKKLSRIIHRISLISQSYIEYLFEPFMVHKIGSDIVFFRYALDVQGGGLMFMKKEKKALTTLLEVKEIPEGFYYYWNDAVNTIGYSAKLLLMFSAIESLVKKNGQKDWNLINKILGESLVKELFGTKKQSNIGLRHRLVHGEYFDDKDQNKNYLELLHNKIISYFNKKIFSDLLISENVIHPQRHFFGNKEFGNFSLKCQDGGQSFSLKDLLQDFSGDWAYNLKKYKQIFDKDFNTTY